MVITQNIDNVLKTALQNNTHNSYGNQILYDMCQKGSMLHDDELADEIWLIGRSYAASPERRFSKKEKNNTFKRGTGTGDYFRFVAEYLVACSEYQNLCSKIKLLYGYDFNGQKQDLDNLCFSIQCVSQLNELIKTASRKYDEKHNAQIALSANTIYKNQISFCSKFLHFQAPDTIFIIDHYTYDGGGTLFSTQCRRSLQLYNTAITPLIRSIFDKKQKDIFSPYPLFGITKHNMEGYIQHCQRSYTMGCVLKAIEQYYAISKASVVTYPRLTDIIFQNVL